MIHDDIVLKDYQSKMILLEEEVKALKKKIDQYAILRLMVFAGAILAIYLLFDYGMGAVMLIALLTVVLFLVLVRVQLKFSDAHRFKTTQLKLLRYEMEETPGVYSTGEEFMHAGHAYTDDLDIFGRHSVFAQLNRCATLQGIQVLASWLRAPADQAEIENRQEAVSELGWHQQQALDFRTRLHPLDKSQVAAVRSFFQEELSPQLAFLGQGNVKLFMLLVPIVNVSLLFLAILLGTPFWSVLGLGLLASGIGYMFFKKRIDLLHDQVSGSVDVLSNYAANLNWLESEEWKSRLLQGYVATIKNEKVLSMEMKQLSKILNNLNYRLNMMVGAFVNLFLQWDLHQLTKLNEWQKVNREQVLKSFDLISEFEALVSLSVLAHNHPEWAQPVIHSDACFKATALGHPLIDTHKRVNNDFSLLGQPTVDVITGSNMAGKSTFLRTVGVNMVLAFAGAKVCAAVFESSVFHLLSYMRIKDSLADQTSTFKAEIDRLKMILDRTAVDGHSFVLIDEMLRGTNSRDKYLGSKVFIEKLVAQGTPGFIATHDLQIAELEKEFPAKVRNFHFDIQVEGQEMFFDYKIKEGECKTFNASMLLKAIGLEVGG